MKMIKKCWFFVLIILFAAMKGDKPAYIIYDAEGKQAKYKDMVDDALKADIVFFGTSITIPSVTGLNLR